MLLKTKILHLLGLDFSRACTESNVLRPVSQGGTGLVQAQGTQLLAQVLLQVILGRPQQPGDQTISKHV